MDLSLGAFRYAGEPVTSAQHFDLLALIAEVSATFVGFSLVVGLLQPGQPGAAARLSSMRGVAELGLVAAGGALLVLILEVSGVSAPLAWRAGSFSLAMSWATALYFALRRAVRAGRSLTDVDPLISGTLASAGILLLAWNAAVPSAASGPRYLMALALALAASAFLFIRAAFERLDGPPAT